MFKINNNTGLEKIYIFLDIDGVLNCKSDWANKFTLNPKCVHSFALLVNKLKKRYKDVLIVISSTWRAGKASEEDGNAKQYQLLLDELNKYNITVCGTTPLSNKGRQKEIEYYIKRNNIKRYIVLDDDDSLFENINEINLYKTNYITGLTDGDIPSILKITR